MDAPTTTSAGNGTSGDSGGGGGWFTPRKAPKPSEGGEPTQPEGSEPEAAESRRVSAIRPLGRSGAASTSAPEARPAPEAERERAADERIPAARDAAEPASAPAAAQSAPHAPASHPEPRPERVPEPRQQPPQGQPGSPQPQAAPQAQAQAQAQPRPEPRPVPQGSPDAIRVQRTMAEIGPVADKVTSYFYALLFTRHPDLRPLFPAAMDTQRDRLLKALLTAAEHIDNTEVLTAYLKNLGRGHRKYGTRPEHYPAVGECLIGSLSRYGSAVWDEETEAAWVRTYTTISQIMIDAAAADELRAPAWWFAEVVSHDLRTPDIAVVTVRPDQPYPFLAGQYTSLETPWWPRIWRHYSFASAPRSDGLLSFHVKAVPAGWVSNALVHHARPGDVLRLGAPAGSMTVDHTTDSGLLCLGGGTGIAPIKALVEDVAEHGERRPVEVFYGARTDHDLYDIDTMLRLQQTHPWLSVRPVVDDHAQFPDAVREYGPWNEYDAYLSGPPGMIRSGVDALRDIGIPAGRIRHDSVEELVAAAD
ncbi:globin domain-containing protein [Streptomyces durmitorensis]|uniref:nitric oxide dioxygenase n=1 Tax=Streptomyces durmitorensis TaxID=319947 RepID=A0ABY4PWG7_9ACTN|nr:globin domain-containing protein [Streptomyces durmitorensis]UQT57529.1 globin domain-containing protein [Streptomyces durmitorensis]